MAERPLARLKSLLQSAFGHWTPPPWLSRLWKGTLAPAISFLRARPGVAAVLFVALLATYVGGRAFESWLRRPKPSLYAVAVQAPKATPLVADAKPEPLHVYFNLYGRRASAAKLQDIHKVLMSGVALKPALAGTWRWESDSELSFTPKEDWPVAETYRIVLDPKLFPDQVKLQSYEPSFTTAPFTAQLTNAEFYQDPVDPKHKEVVATLRFSHPVDIQDFPTHVQLQFRTRGVFGAGAKPVPFSVRYDKLRGEAYVHSDSLDIPQDDSQVVITVSPGVRSSRGGKGTTTALERTISIPGRENLFRVQGIELVVADDEKGEPQQILLLRTTTDVLETELQKAISAVALPADQPATSEEEAIKNMRWLPQEVGESVLKLSTPLALIAVPAEHEATSVHTFRYKAPPGRYLYVTVKAGVKSFGGYVLPRNYEEVALVPDFPPELHILGDGAVLGLNGERKVSVLARELRGLRFELARVIPGQVNHLVTQTEGRLQSPEFVNYRFGPDDIAERYEKTDSLAHAEPGKSQYTAFDFSSYLAPPEGGTRRGLFFLRVTGYDPETKTITGPSDNRLILITDLGLLVKDNADLSHDVFVQSLSTGTPAAQVDVQVLGRNGLAVAHATTDQDGHCHLPSLGDFTREREPVTYLARLADDVSFLPYHRLDRELSFSRFDVGGRRNDVRESVLHAYLFSDRGLYRPGDTVHVGAIVKAADWDRQVGGIPLQATVSDPRGQRILERKITVSPAGFEDITFQTDEGSPTGPYQVSLFLLKADGYVQGLLGQTTVRVEEFQPDRMRIKTRLSEEHPEGWVNPQDLSVDVELQNLFGTPAENRRVTATLNLVPAIVAFRRYREYVFFDPAHAKQSFSEPLPEGRTDAQGHAHFDLSLQRFERATYQLTFAAQGFEAEGGRAVSAESTALVSSFPHLIGFKPDGDLSYIKLGSQRSVELLAVDPTLAPTAIADLHVHLIEERYVSVLTAQPNGTYKYVSTLKELSLGDQTLSLPNKPHKLVLPTDKPGKFFLSLRDTNGIELNRIAFTVVGEANLTRSLERNAELQIDLNKRDYAPGETVEVSIRAPYTGAGLITVERDHVFAYKWFRTNTTSSVQTLQLPKDLEANGYVEVAFVRAMDSAEIFMSPLSYGVVPFSISRQQRDNHVSLEAPEKVRPGEPLKISYKAEHPGRIVVFAVDEGILQVARYRTPDPLAFFFQKRALEVRTAQILDLLLPEFSILKRVSAAGGDEAGRRAIGKNLNPFKRKHEKPVAFWSGIMPVDTTAQTITFQMPDSFSGQLRLMAVAVSPSSVGATERDTTVRGPIVISPNAPTFVAPGDEFVVSVGLANQAEGSSDKAQVELDLTATHGLQILDGEKRSLTIAEGHESSTAFRVKALDELGSRTLSFKAHIGSAQAKLETTLSVRPTTPYQVTLQSGVVTSDSQDVPVPRRMYGEFRTLRGSVSRLPLALATGLARYLASYPYGCTEQVVSQAFSALVLRDRPEFKADLTEANRTLQRSLEILAARQTSTGAFGYWAANSSGSDLIDAYALHFLTEAKERGTAVPRELLAQGLAHLKELEGQPLPSIETGRAQAYALYVRARNGQSVGAAAAALEGNLALRFKDTWSHDLAAVFLAGAYALGQQVPKAEKLVAGVDYASPVPPDYRWFYDSWVRDGMLLYIVSRHLKEEVPHFAGDKLARLAIGLGQSFNSFSAASLILGFDALSSELRARGLETGKLSIEESVGGQMRALALASGAFPYADFSPDADKLRFAEQGGFPLFFQAVQGGFDLQASMQASVQAINKGIEVHREYRRNGQPVTSAKIGETVDVALQLRSLAGNVPRIAVVDLLPAGFEVSLREPAHENAIPADVGIDSVPPARERERRPSTDVDDESEGSDDGEPVAASPPGSIQIVESLARGGDFHPEFADVREDRVVLYGEANPKAAEFIYTIRATNEGQVQTPPTFAESMYDKAVSSRGTPGTFKVEAH